MLPCHHDVDVARHLHGARVLFNVLDDPFVLDERSRGRGLRCCRHGATILSEWECAVHRNRGEVQVQGPSKEGRCKVQA